MTMHQPLTTMPLCPTPTLREKTAMPPVSRFRLVAIALLGGLAVFPWTHARAEERGSRDLVPTVGSIERLDPRFDALVPKGAVIEAVSYTHLTLPTNREV